MSASEQSAREPVVFFVDDDFHVLNALRRALVEEPWELSTFTSPEKAIARVMPDAPAVVVADFYMPGVLGCDLLTRVRDLDPAVSRVILTAKPDLSTVVCSVDPGTIHRYLIKPWDNEQLRDTIARCIESFREARARLGDPRDELEESA